MQGADQDRGEHHDALVKSSIKYDELPDPREILSPDKALYVVGLFEEAEILSALIEQNKTRLEELKVALGELQRETRQKGIRYRDWVFYERQAEGKKTLNRALLLENGVKAAMIAKSVKVGKAFVERRLVNTRKEKPEEEE
jgi:hypothetical protein